MLIEKFTCVTGLTFCRLITVVILVRCSLESLTAPAAPWPVVLDLLLSLDLAAALLFDASFEVSLAAALSDFAFTSALLLSAALARSGEPFISVLEFSSALIWPGVGEFVDWPMVSGIDLCSPALIDGAIFEGGAFCCAAGA